MKNSLADLLSNQAFQSDKIISDLTFELMVLSKAHFLGGFEHEGTTTESNRSGWQRRKYPKKNKTPILEDTGRLKDSIQVVNTSNGFKVWTDTPYAIYHNEGIGNLPKREIMGESVELDGKINKRIKNKLDELSNKN